MTSLAYDWLPRHKLTVADFHRMGRFGVFHEDDRVELIEGEIIDMAPIGSMHAGTLFQLAECFRKAVGASAFVWVQNPVRLDQHSEPEPDLALLRPRTDYYKTSLPQAEDIILIVEVADASLRYDREMKVPLYARYGIAEVWLLDLENRRLEIFRGPQAGEYGAHQAFERPPLLAPERMPECRLDLSGIW